MYSDVRGSVTLKTADPHDQPAMVPYNGGETSPGTTVTTDDEIRDWVARDAETALHPSCTVRMGVVDASAMPA